MLARETGTTVFYSPALEADMVTGFTHVPMTGWGVMVPQPVAELRDAATLDSELRDRDQRRGRNRRRFLELVFVRISDPCAVVCCADVPADGGW